MTVSRRDFLAATAAAAAAPPLSAAGLRFQPAQPRRFAPGAAPLDLVVNGRKVTLEAEPRETLLEVLRWHLGLTGAKDVCDRGSCGACTVLVDGLPRLSCMTLAVEVAGRQITTVEGLGTPEKPGAVQAAFVRHDAVQCGYCIPGFVLSAEAVRRRNPKAPPQELREALAGNLCRCGSYNKVLEAAERACGGDPKAGEPERNAAACVENNLGRVDAPEKICGTAVYSADVRRPAMLFARHILCPFGRAKLAAGDVEAARKLPGVAGVHLQVGRTFEYCGAPAGWACAESPAALRDAIHALQLRWEPEPVETDPLRLHEAQHGPFPPPEEERRRWNGAEEAEAALKDARVVVERTYTTEVHTHSTFEPHGATVDPTASPPEGWFSTQGTFTCVDALAEGLDLPKDQVAVRCDHVGGGFGSKFGAGREGALAAELAGRFGRPVRVFNEREGEQLDTGYRPGSLQWMQIGASADGKILGGYVYVAGIVGADSGGGGATNPSRYNFGRAVARNQVEVQGVHGAPRPCRAPGHPQGMFAVESMMDELAEALEMDPLEFRLRNDPSVVRKAMYAAGAAEIGWGRRQPTGSQKGRLRRGLGVGCGSWGSGEGPCDVRMTALPDGRVVVWSGTQDIGTGQRTVLADTAADALGLPREHIEVRVGSSQYPAGPASGGSTTARLTAPAVRDAAAKLLQHLPALGGQKPERVAAWEAAVRSLPADGLSVDGAFNSDYWGRGGGSDAVQFAEVLVDAETGVVRVEKIVALQACGQVVNRLTAENQVIGGVIQGVSFALFEERVNDPQLGYQLNADLERYRIAGMIDVPQIVPILWPQEGAGVRSLGEPPTIPTAGAIANAVANALGARVRALPITPEKVLRALAEQA